MKKGRQLRYFDRKAAAGKIIIPDNKSVCGSCILQELDFYVKCLGITRS